jgi:hypothetical protein
MALLMSPVGFDHGRFQLLMARACISILPELVWTGPVTLNFEDKTNPEPDLIGWKGQQPWVVVEIAQTTQKADFGYKRELYQSNGVPFYVVYDIARDWLELLGLDAKGNYMGNPNELEGIRAIFRELLGKG